MAHPSAEQLARQYYDFFNRRLIEDASRLIHAQAVFHYPHTREHLIGRAGYRELARLWLSAFPDAQITITRMQVEDGHRVTTDLIGRGTLKGPLMFGGLLTMEPTGRAAELPFRDILDVHDGLVTAVWLHFDVQEMLRRLNDAGPKRGK
jgi:predicted ester cyclase